MVLADMTSTSASVSTSVSTSVSASASIPPKRGGNFKYPWNSLAVGDSFLVTVKIGVISSAAGRASKRLGRKFSCRTTDEGIRVWRIV